MRGLMNRRVAISELERPSRASRAISASWAVRSSRVSTLRLRAVSPVGEELAPRSRRERLDAHRGQRVVGGAQLFTGVDAAALSTQPFAVEQVGAGVLDADLGSAETRDRFAIVRFGGVALAQQRADSGFDSQCPLGRGHARTFGQPLERGPDERQVTGPGRRLGQLGHEKGPAPERIGLERPPRGVACRVVATEAVVEHSLRVRRRDDARTA